MQPQLNPLYSPQLSVEKNSLPPSHPTAAILSDETPQESIHSLQRVLGLNAFDPNLTLGQYVIQAHLSGKIAPNKQLILVNVALALPPHSPETTVTLPENITVGDGCTFNSPHTTLEIQGRNNLRLYNRQRYLGGIQPTAEGAKIIHIFESDNEVLMQTHANDQTTQTAMALDQYQKGPSTTNAYHEKNSHPNAFLGTEVI